MRRVQRTDVHLLQLCQSGCSDRVRWNPRQEEVTHRLREFGSIMRGEHKPVFYSISGHEQRGFVIIWRIIVVEKLERGETSS